MIALLGKPKSTQIDDSRRLHDAAVSSLSLNGVPNYRRVDVTPSREGWHNLDADTPIVLATARYQNREAAV